MSLIHYIGHIIICKLYNYKIVSFFCWFRHLFGSRAEICQIFSFVIWSKRWHQEDILKLTDLYKVRVRGNWRKSSLFLHNFSRSAPQIDANTFIALRCIDNFFYHISSHQFNDLFWCLSKKPLKMRQNK